MDVEVIRNIPLNMRRQHDFWALHYEGRGFFSVRSAYRMLVNDKQRTRAWLEDRSGTSDTRATEKEWLAIWKVNVPAKIRVFLWRLARHSLSSGDVLHHRNMATHNLCGICGEPDSWKHALLECNLARCVWALECEEIVENICSIQEMNARGCLKEVTMWAIWYARRKAVHENIFQSPLSTHSFVDRFNHAACTHHN